MALFIVLWLSSSSEQVQKAVGGYFTDPTGKGKRYGERNARAPGAKACPMQKEDMNKLKDKLEQAVKSSAALQKIREHVIFTVTARDCGWNCSKARTRRFSNRAARTRRISAKTC